MARKTTDGKRHADDVRKAPRRAGGLNGMKPFALVLAACFFLGLPSGTETALPSNAPPGIAGRSSRRRICRRTVCRICSRRNCRTLAVWNWWNVSGWIWPRRNWKWPLALVRRQRANAYSWADGWGPTGCCCCRSSSASRRSTSRW